MASKTIVILPCAGGGSRFGGAIPKQYTLINGKTILEHTLNVFLLIRQIDQIVIVAAPNDEYVAIILQEIRRLKLSANKHDVSKIKILRVGGKSRANSVKNGLDALNCSDDDWILVHDVARCCITGASVVRLITDLEKDEVGGILATPAVDTIKQSDNGLVIDKTLERSSIFQAQTPQMFRAGVLGKALNLANLDLVTDEASAVEYMGLPVKLVMGEPGNIKVTYPQDTKLAEIILDENQALQ
jgi:2-C-methyl-D-erythritol 4-phosphate cytidylyltransferase